MKRRLFLKGLLGASAVAPVVVKAITSEPQLYSFGESTIEYSGEEDSPIEPSNKLLTPEQVTNEALMYLEINMRLMK